MPTLLDRKISKPLYWQLAEILKKELAQYAPGDRFYADRELCRKYNISQPVVRGALSILVEEGCIERVMSKGTFVRTPAARTERRKTGAIGLFSILENGYPQVDAVRGVEKIAMQAGYDILLRQNRADVASDPEALREAILSMTEKTDGIIWVSPIMVEIANLPMALAAYAEKVVFINAVLLNPSFSCVIADYESGAAAAVAHVVNLGHKTVGYIGGPEERLVSRMRYSGFRKAVQQVGMPMDADYILPFTDGLSCEEGRKIALKLLKQKALPEAIFCVTNEIALGVFMTFRENGVSVPADVALIGCDHNPAYQKFGFDLTVVKRPYRELGETAARQLLDQLAGKRAAGVKQFVPCPLIIRESCGCNVLKVRS